MFLGNPAYRRTEIQYIYHRHSLPGFPFSSSKAARTLAAYLAKKQIKNALYDKHSITFDFFYVRSCDENGRTRRLRLDIQQPRPNGLHLRSLRRHLVELEYDHIDGARRFEALIGAAILRVAHKFPTVDPVFDFRLRNQVERLSLSKRFFRMKRRPVRRRV